MLLRRAYDAHARRRATYASVSGCYGGGARYEATGATGAMRNTWRYKTINIGESGSTLRCYARERATARADSVDIVLTLHVSEGANEARLLARLRYAWYVARERMI